jgi:cytochrome c-type biogenesis protein CcmF
VAVSTAYGMQDEVVMSPSSVFNLQGYRIQFIRQSALKGPNYEGTKAQFAVSGPESERVKMIFPEKRFYNVGQMALADSAIDVNPFRDIYIALGEPLKGDSWSVRIYYKPFVRWIWAGGFIMLAGGLLALSDRRYYQRRNV